MNLIARSVLLSCCMAAAAAAVAQGGRIDAQTSGATRGQPAGGASGETAGSMQGPMAPDAKAVEVAPALSAAALAVASSKAYGVYLTDARGRALYLLEDEREPGGRCDEACAAIWPPLLAGKGEPAARDAVKKELIGTAKRPDGSLQVTYNGHPLYYYAKDRGQGRATGQDVHDRWGEWYLVKPGGSKLEEHEEAASGRSR